MPLGGGEKYSYKVIGSSKLGHAVVLNPPSSIGDAKVAKMLYEQFRDSHEEAYPKPKIVAGKISNTHSASDGEIEKLLRAVDTQHEKERRSLLVRLSQAG